MWFIKNVEIIEVNKIFVILMYFKNCVKFKVMYILFFGINGY